ncbi:MAG TPA: hypothetical protein VFL47_01850 [Flavisolibacter sp.]|nr:hypothetical protein [Flavisolibacter sp.]
MVVNRQAKRWFFTTALLVLTGSLFCQGSETFTNPLLPSGADP